MTYYCEFLFSVVKFIKSKLFATPTNEHLGKLSCTPSTMYCQIFQRLANQTNLSIDKWCVSTTVGHFWENLHSLLCFYCHFKLIMWLAGILVFLQMIMRLAGILVFLQMILQLNKFTHHCYTSYLATYLTTYLGFGCTEWGLRLLNCWQTCYAVINF